MSGTITDLAVAGQLLAKSMRRRIRGGHEPGPDLDVFGSSMQILLDGAPAGLIESYCWLDLAANQAPWVACDMTLSANDEISYFVEGRVYANQLLDIWLPLSLQIWSKVGDGPLFRGTRASHSFTAQQGGPLQFGNYFPNDWADPSGNRQQSDTVYKAMTGATRILIVRWTGPALDCLRALRKTGDHEQRLTCEIDRIENGDVTPAGWYPLWNIGPSEIYRDGISEQGNPCIHCHTSGDTGILQKDVDMPLRKDSELRWRWCVEQLPSPLREDSVPSHDYLSIAVEFDNGRDITYYWSSSLPVGTGYDCPLPNWKGKEFHVVIRSGEQGLGEWHAERRNLYSDYLHYMGEPPGRIVRVWLIANSLFQRNRGSCDYSDIVLHQGDEAIPVSGPLAAKTQ